MQNSRCWWKTALGYTPASAETCFTLERNSQQSLYRTFVQRTWINCLHWRKIRLKFFQILIRILSIKRFLSLGQWTTPAFLLTFCTLKLSSAQHCLNGMQGLRLIYRMKGCISLSALWESHSAVGCHNHSLSVTTECITVKTQQRHITACKRSCNVLFGQIKRRHIAVQPNLCAIFN